MSARVANPFTLYEMRRLSETVAASRPVMSFPEARARVCRNLYGRASADDSRAFAARELSEQRESAAERWGFDFAREAPRTHGPGAERFKWTRVKIGTVPAAYRVPRMLPLASTANANASAEPSQPHETARTTVTTVEEALIVAEAATAAATTTVVATTGLVIPDLASPPSSSTGTSSTSEATTTTSTPTPPTRQSKMTEYMNIRKRALSKKVHHLQTEQPPAKRARTTEPHC